MKAADPRRNDRIKAAAGVVMLEGLLAWGLIAGLGVRMPAVREQLELVAIALEPPRPPIVKIVPPRARTRKPEGAASPPNLKAKPTEIAAPKPALPAPSPVAAAPKPGPGAAPSAGASAVRGPGTGSGGQGNGTGSGGAGNGAGGGGYATPARWLKGRLKNKDYPRAAGEARVGGSVTVRFTIAPNGRAIQCVVTGSSGSAALDETTCRLIEQRYRYKPARDANGKAVPSIETEIHDWDVTTVELPADDERPR
jgi:protein TonB